MSDSSSSGPATSPDANEPPSVIDAGGTQFEVDPAVSPNEQSQLNQVFQSLQAQNIDGSKTRWFGDVFGGDSRSDVMNFLSQRTHSFLGSATDFVSRVLISGQPMTTSTSRQPNPLEAAANVGFVLWVLQQAVLPTQIQFELGNQLISPDSSRVGIIQLGPAFTSSRVGDVTRIATIVHESRHSDCTGGLYESDLRALNAGSPPKNHQCGHLHVNCPSGHELAGLPACDDLPWGAYSVQAIYQSALSAGCLNCTEADRQAAMVGAMDSASRVLVYQSMIAGTLGGPDMSSTDVVVSGR